MHDTVELERHGIPATAIITAAFRGAALFQFRSRGMPGHSWVELPHPVSNLPAPEMRALAARFADEVARQLTAPAAG